MTEFKRLNYFTGLFLTARDFQDEQAYGLEKHKLHNQGLHTPGILRGVRDELKVVAGGGPVVNVLPGAALLGDGNEVYLDAPYSLSIPLAASQRVYIVLRYTEKAVDYVKNVEAEQYSGYTRTSELPVIQVQPNEPDANLALELARIDLNVGAVVEITDPADPANPGPNAIDRRYVIWAGAACDCQAKADLVPDLVERLALLMKRTREDFAALDGRFPVPSAGDVRHAALTVELLARSGGLPLLKLANVLAVVASVEQDVAQELGTIYPVLPRLPEFGAYADAEAGLLAVLRSGSLPDALFNAQEAVSIAARELSEAITLAPVAATGGTQLVTTPYNVGFVNLDASGSVAYGGRSIVHYYWKIIKSDVNLPVAAAGNDQTITAQDTDSEVSVTLDASNSRAGNGKTIVSYRWDQL